VDAIVEGSIAHSGDRVRINAQLIETATDHHLWAKTYDRDMRDVLAIQSQVAQAIASAVQIELTPGEQARLSKSAGTTSNPAAHQLYLLGRYHWGRWSADGMVKAISYFQQAIASDPAYAPAWSGLAAAYAAQGGEPALARAREVMPKAREAAQKALAIDDKLAEAHSGLASVKLFYDWDGKGFEREIRRAIDLNPNYADAHGLYGAYFDAIGKTEDALRERKRALELDPLNPFVNMAVAIPLFYGRRYGEATEWPLKAIDLDPSFAEAHNLLGSIYYKRRNYDQWLAETVRERGSMGVKPETTTALLTAYHSAGLPGYWREELKQAKVREQSGSVSPMDMARIYMELGELDRALDYLEKACNARVSWVIFLGVNPLYDGLRGKRRLEKMVKRIGLKY
jgi:tetratricopeptide (TPR) repeat protein